MLYTHYTAIPYLLSFIEPRTICNYDYLFVNQFSWNVELRTRYFGADICVLWSEILICAYVTISLCYIFSVRYIVFCLLQLSFNVKICESTIIVCVTSVKLDECKLIFDASG